MMRIGFCRDGISELDSIASVSKAVPEAAWYSAGILSHDTTTEGHVREICQQHSLQVLLHALDLDLCGVDPLDPATLEAIGGMADRLDSAWITTDLAMWSRGGEHLLENLIPVPLMQCSIDWVAPRVRAAIEAIGRPISVENAPYPFTVGAMDPLEVVRGIAEAADCLITLDVGHLYSARLSVAADARQKIDDEFPWERVVEVHFSGLSESVLSSGVLVIEDTHGWSPEPALWEFADYLLPRCTNVQAFLSEAEGMDESELINTLRAMDAATHRWMATAA